MNLVNVAIDGPAGAGKSTIAKLVAEKLSYVYVDTGAMYRAIGYYILKDLKKTDNDVELLKDETIETCVKQKLHLISIDIAYESGEQQIFLNGENVSKLIRTPSMGTMASKVSQFYEVRKYLVKLQQEMAKKQPVVMDGRDIGTHVLPNAKLKIYLTASVEIRAKRRYQQLIDKGEKADIDLLIEEITARDYNDMNREHAPLRQADDALLLDSSELSIEEVVKKIYTMAVEKNTQISK